MTAAVHLPLVVSVAALQAVTVAVRRPPLLLLLLRLLQSQSLALAVMTAVAPQQSQSLARALAAVDAVAPLPAAALHHLTKEAAMIAAKQICAYLLLSQDTFEYVCWFG